MILLSMNDITIKYYPLVEEINQTFSQLYNLSNDELREELKKAETAINKQKSPKRALSANLVNVFAIVKETARRFSRGNVMVTANDNDIYLAENFDFVSINDDKACYKNKWDVGGIPFQWDMVHYDEQLLGGILLHYGYAVEMATGEGKTLVATLPIVLNALTHKGVHLMTANDYLSKRDYEMTRPIYMFHGLTADCIEKYSRDNSRKKDAYCYDITFGTNSSFTFDYLFDHLAMTPGECLQQKHNFAIIDELDSILIDDAETPHIVGGGNYYNEGDIYKENLPIIKELIEADNSKELYTSSVMNKTATFTSRGEKWLSERKAMPDLFSIKHTYEIEYFDALAVEEKNDYLKKIYTQNVLLQLLRALTVFERDVDYIIADGKVKIIDPNTGRAKENSRWEHGLHTAIEVKEGVDVKDDFDGMAVISLKNYFKLYDKIAGMSGTIMPASKELSSIYHLKCAALPTHKPMIRVDEPLRIYHTKEQKDNAVVNLILQNQKAGRPTLVGNINLKRSDQIANILEERGTPFNRLDARTAKGEAVLVAKAGIGNTITVSTSVAGRGTDIKPSEDALANGGLMVIGTDLFDSIRIDKQLKGRSGRQGNPGSSVFFASLEDNTLNYLSESERKQLQAIGEEAKDETVLSKLALPFFEKAQANREEISRKSRMNVAKKDDIVAPRRYKFYEQRNRILFDRSVAESLVNEICVSFGMYSSNIEEHLESLYSLTKILIERYFRNNPNTTSVSVPFSDNRHPFTIRLDATIARQDFNYFSQEFKRQTVLQLYDSNWKGFVIYMMGNLDSHEISLLDEKYEKMMKDINAQIISRLTSSTILFDAKKKDGDDDPGTTKCPQKGIRSKNAMIPSDSPCPCGSGKKYCDCHGSNNRSNSRIRRRR